MRLFNRFFYLLGWFSYRISFTWFSLLPILIIYSGGPISYKSHLQTSVALSTTEAEVVVASESAGKLIWLKRLVTKLNQLKEVPVLKVDNEAAIKLTYNPEFHRRTKHIRIRIFLYVS